MDERDGAAEPKVRLTLFDSGPLAANCVEIRSGLASFVDADVLRFQIAQQMTMSADQFDLMYEDVITVLSRRAGFVWGMLDAGRSGVRAEPAAQRKAVCGQLLENCMSVLVSSVSLTRCGHPIEALLLVRNALEVIGTAVALDRNPDQVPAFLSGQFDSGKAIGEAKRSLEYLGVFYGEMSKHYAHLGKGSQVVWGAQGLRKGKVATELALGVIDLMLDALEVATELILYPYLSTHRRLRQIGEGAYECVPQPRVLPHVTA